MHEEDLERGAPLAVEGERPQDALAHRGVEVGVLQDDGGVLRLQPEHGTQAVRSWVLLLQQVGDRARPDEGEHVDLA
jgi:hypothetical protein